MEKQSEEVRQKIAQHEEFVARARAERRVDRLSTDDQIAREVEQINNALLLAQEQRALKARKQAEEVAMRENEANKEGA